MGYGEYHPVAEEFSVPVVVTGFEPVDIMQGILWTVRQLEKGEHRVENAYGRAVTEKGNIPAKELLNEVFTVCDRNWRGIGTIPASGLTLSGEYREFDAEERFDLSDVRSDETGICIAGLILKGQKIPGECPAFGTQCTPEHPLGAPMVSAEGACSAYYRYRKQEVHGI